MNLIDKEGTLTFFPYFYILRENIREDVDIMLVLPQKIKVKWNPSNQDHFKGIGYAYTKKNDEFEVDVLDLPINSNINIMVLCDYCMEEGKEKIVDKTYQKYNKQREYVKKDACFECMSKKQRDVTLVKYSIDSTNKLQKVKDKKKETFQEKYGQDSYLQTKEGKEKIQETNIKKYGVKNPMQNKTIKEKAKNTNLEKYGETNYAKTDEYKEKVIITNLERYGTEWAIASEDVREKIVESFYNNGSQKSSIQQRFLHSLLGGEINYPIGRCSVDIAFIEEKIYFEYSGEDIFLI